MNPNFKLPADVQYYMYSTNESITGFFSSLLGSLPSWGSSTKEGRGLFVLRWSLFLNAGWEMERQEESRKKSQEEKKKTFKKYDKK